MKKQEIPTNLRWLASNASPGRLITYAANDAHLASILSHHSAHASVRRYLEYRAQFEADPSPATQARARGAKSYMVTALLSHYGQARLDALDPRAEAARATKLEHRLDSFRQAHKRERALVAELTRGRDEARESALRWMKHARSAELQTCSAQNDLRIQAERANDCAAESRSLRAQLSNTASLAQWTALNEECAALRAEYNRQVELSVGARNEAAALRAEVERLRNDPMSKRAYAAESHLAAANALLERCLDDFAGIVATPAEADRIVVAIRAHLAAQPATAPAPTRAEELMNPVCYCLKSEESDCPTRAAGLCPRARKPTCPVCDDPIDADHVTPCMPCHAQPTAPARDEELPNYIQHPGPIRGVRRRGQPATAPARDEACSGCGRSAPEDHVADCPMRRTKAECQSCPKLLEQRNEARATVEELAAKLGFAVEW